MSARARRRVQNFAVVITERSLLYSMLLFQSDEARCDAAVPAAGRVGARRGGERGAGQRQPALRAGALRHRLRQLRSTGTRVRDSNFDVLMIEPYHGAVAQTLDPKL